MALAYMALYAVHEAESASSQVSDLDSTVEELSDNVSNLESELEDVRSEVESLEYNGRRW